MNLSSPKAVLESLFNGPPHGVEVLMFSALAFIVATYVGYPVVLMLFSRIAAKPLRPAVGGSPDTQGGGLPQVTCIVAAHNEGEQLIAKVRNLLDLDYPAERLKVLIADDSSTDGSPARARALNPQRVQVVSNPSRQGKSCALVHAVKASEGDILLMCDTRQRFEAGVARALVRPFADPSVGAVTGCLLLEGTRGPGVYWRYELAIRKMEARVGSMVGVTGAIYAIRRECFPLELPPETLLDDLYVPMRAVLAGWRVVCAEDARAFDVEQGVEREFKRKVRTLTGNYQLVALLPWLLLPWRNPLFWQFAWHKLARLLCPWALALALLCSLVAPGLRPMLIAMLLLGVCALAVLGMLRGERAGRLARLCHTFLALNFAAVLGLWNYLRGDFQVTWNITQQKGPV